MSLESPNWKLKYSLISSGAIAICAGLAWAYHTYIKLPYAHNDIPSSSEIFKDDHFIIAEGEENPNQRIIQLDSQSYMEDVDKQCEAILGDHPSPYAVSDCNNKFQSFDGSILGTATNPQVTIFYDRDGNIPLNHFGTVTMTQEQMLDFLQTAEYQDRFTVDEMERLLVQTGYTLLLATGTLGLARLGIAGWRHRQKHFQEKLLRKLQREEETIALVHKNRTMTTSLPTKTTAIASDLPTTGIINPPPSPRAEYLINEMKSAAATVDQVKESTHRNIILREIILAERRRDLRYQGIEQILKTEIVTQLVDTADGLKYGSVSFSQISPEADEYPVKKQEIRKTTPSEKENNQDE